MESASKPQEGIEVSFINAASSLDKIYTADGDVIQLLIGDNVEIDLRKFEVQNSTILVARIMNYGMSSIQTLMHEASKIAKYQSINNLQKVAKHLKKASEVNTERNLKAFTIYFPLTLIVDETVNAKFHTIQLSVLHLTLIGDITCRDCMMASVKRNSASTGNILASNVYLVGEYTPDYVQDKPFKNLIVICYSYDVKSILFTNDGVKIFNLEYTADANGYQYDKSSFTGTFTIIPLKIQITLYAAPGTVKIIDLNITLGPDLISGLTGTRRLQEDEEMYVKFDANSDWSGVSDAKFTVIAKDSQQIKVENCPSKVQVQKGEYNESGNHQMGETITGPPEESVNDPPQDGGDGPNTTIIVVGVIAAVVVVAVVCVAVWFFVFRKKRQIEDEPEP